MLMVCIESLNLLNIDCEFKLSKKDLRLAMDVTGTSDILWSDVMNEIWCANQNNYSTSAVKHLFSYFYRSPQ